MPRKWTEQERQEYALALRIGKKELERPGVRITRQRLERWHYLLSMKSPTTVQEDLEEILTQR